MSGAGSNSEGGMAEMRSQMCRPRLQSKSHMSLFSQVQGSDSNAPFRRMDDSHLT